MTLSTTLIKSIQDILRQDAGVDGDAQRISRLCGLVTPERLPGHP
jgi:type I restriction enzyme M protein